MHEGAGWRYLFDPVVPSKYRRFKAAQALEPILADGTAYKTNPTFSPIVREGPRGDVHHRREYAEAMVDALLTAATDGGNL